MKVLIKSGHSDGRGVGYYTTHLIKALRHNKEVEIVDNNPDIIHYPYFDLFYHTFPIKKEKPTVVTIHDVTPLAMPERYPKGIKGAINLFLQKLALKNVSAIITDSEYSKKDIVKYLKIDNKKIFVTPLAVDDIYREDVTDKKLKEVKAKYNLPDKFVLNVSAGPNPNKNLPALAIATGAINIPLVIVGKGMLQEVTEPVHPELIDLVKLKPYKHILYPGFVPDEDLLAMYKLATLYCQPSLYEGFGLPVLEAMTAGCIVVSSNTASLPEIYPKETITFNPKDKKEIQSKLLEALEISTKSKELLINKAKAKSDQFSWDSVCKKTIDVYHQSIK